jgi:hypothetical protein
LLESAGRLAIEALPAMRFSASGPLATVDRYACRFRACARWRKLRAS